jgi:hypothetical protein
MPSMDIHTLTPEGMTALKGLVKAIRSPGNNPGDTATISLNLQVQADLTRRGPADNGAVSYLDLAGFLASKLSAAALSAALAEWEHSEATGRGVPPRKPEAAKAIKAAQQRVTAARAKRPGNVDASLSGTITY